VQGLYLMRLLAGSVGVAGLLYLLMCVGLFVFQRTLLYAPQPARFDVPGMPLPVSGAELQVSVRVLANAPALLYFGGNAEDVSGTWAELVAAFPGRSLYLMHYRGYGHSTGKPAEAALHADALALYEHVRHTLGGEGADIALMGRSLGSGVALRLASEHPVSQLILVTPYDSIAAVAAGRFPWVPVRWLLLDTFDSAALAPRITVPTTIITAEHDEVILRERTDALVGRFSVGLARVVRIPGTGHNNVSGGEAFRQALPRL
jgi:pimeloyl-ACP methyl ester carboxylesterase